MSDQNDTLTPPAEKKLGPYDFLARFPGAPTQAQVTEWKEKVPGGRVKLKVSNDEKRVFLMRGIGALELAQVQAQLMTQNIAPEKLAQEVVNAVVCRCCLWTSASADGKLTDQILKASGAGLAETLNAVLSELSDYEDPATIERLSVEL